MMIEQTLDTVSQPCSCSDLIFQSTGYPLDSREARINLSWNYKRKPEHPEDYSCRKYAGCLKGSGIFKGDAVAIQRSMRDDE
jgi:hypothetical protein